MAHLLRAWSPVAEVPCRAQNPPSFGAFGVTPVPSLFSLFSVGLWIAGRLQPWQERAFRTFLAEISERISDARAEGQPEVRIDLLPPPTW